MHTHHTGLIAVLTTIHILMKLAIDLGLQNLISASKTEWVEKPVGLDCSSASDAVGGGSLETL